MRGERDQLGGQGFRHGLGCRPDVWRGVICLALLLSLISSVAGASSQFEIPTWVELTPLGAPPSKRALHTAVMADAVDRMIVFGGGGEEATQLNDTWLLENSTGTTGIPTWTNVFVHGLPGQPPARHSHSAAYSHGEDALMVFGGRTQTPSYYNDTWVLRNASKSNGTPEWRLVAPGNAPGVPVGRSLHCGGFDEQSNRMIVFGGGAFAAGYLNDTWVLTEADGSGGTPQWIQLIPNGAPGSPPKRGGAVCQFDSQANRLVLFGGQRDGTTPYNDTWVLENATGLGGIPKWIRRGADGATGSPPRRAYASGAYDRSDDRLIVFGGYAFTPPPYLNDTWVLRNASRGMGVPEWVLLIPRGSPGSPEGRDSAASAYNPTADRFFVFGGGVNLLVENDLWMLADASPTISELSSASGQLLVAAVGATILLRACSTRTCISPPGRSHLAAKPRVRESVPATSSLQ